MDVDLTLLVASSNDDPEMPGLLRTRTRLGLDRDSLLWDEIALMDPDPISCGSVVLDWGSRYHSDANGNPLTWVSPSELVECLANYLNSRDWAEPPVATVAAAAYLATLPPGMPINLYWW